MDEKLLTAISVALAEVLNNQNSANINNALESVFPSGFTADEKNKALSEAKIYNLSASIPGNPPDGRPGWLSSNINPKLCVLNEIHTMMDADFDEDERKQAWKKLVQSLEDAPVEDFENGVDVNCPDDYILSLKAMTCLEAINQQK